MRQSELYQHAAEDTVSVCRAIASAVRGSGSLCYFEWDRAIQGMCNSWLSMVFMLTKMGSQMWVGSKGEIQGHKPTKKGLLSTCLVYDSCQKLKLPSFCGLRKTRQKLSGEQLHHFVRVINCFLRLWPETVLGVISMPS